MRMTLRNGDIQLVPGMPLAIRGARGVVLECSEGVVWFTIEGRIEDFMLARGESVRIDNNGLALVEGSPSGAIRLLSEAPSSTAWAARVSQPLRDLGWALCLAGRALGRLVLGLAGYGQYLVAGRGRVLTDLEANPP